MKPSESNLTLSPADAGSDAGPDTPTDAPTDTPIDAKPAPRDFGIPRGDDEIRRIMTDVMARRARGELLSDEQVLGAHPPHLRRQIAEELEGLRMIRRVLLAARKAGPIDEPVPAMDTAQLEAPIEEPPPDQHLTPWDDPTKPLHVQGYQILCEVSRGGQATVFKAIQEVTGRRVAIKVLTGGALAGSRHRARFEREAQALALLDHPNVVGILDRGRTVDGSFFLAMPFIDGCPLDEYAAEAQITDGEFPVPVLRTFVKIARAVHEAHRLGIIHRDLKPSNIRIDARGEPHLLDFGLARLFDPETGGPVPGLRHTQSAAAALTLEKQVLGSLPWTSPEQADGGAARVDARGDVYALGVCLYQSLTGRFPYPVGGSMTEIVRHITTTPAAPLRWTTVRYSRVGDLEAVLARALAKSPEHRYASAADLATDLEALLEGESTQAAHGFFFPLSRWVRPLLWGLLLCCVAGFAWSLRRPSPSTAPAPVTTFTLPTQVNKFGMRMVRIPAGEFWMGTPANSRYRPTDERQHKVRIKRDFWISDREVTRGQFQQLMSVVPDGENGLDDALPVTNVSWNTALAFCKNLSALEGKSYRLPTEAQWEYACRAGAQAPFAGTGIPNQMGWHMGITGVTGLHLGGLKQANHWGLYDFHGNAAEWCRDQYAAQYPERLDPIDPDDESLNLLRVVRGGSFNSLPDDCRSAARDKQHPLKARSDLGFRVVIEEPTPGEQPPAR
jgi:formylglycine-generating enzyme required for sulfatase activity/tRNA A-37 threonylcarbamoyl transferase component Bud32